MNCFQIYLTLLGFFTTIGYAQSPIILPIKHSKMKGIKNHSRFLDSLEVLKIDNIENQMYTMEIKIGKGKQPFNVQLDTGSNVLWVASRDCVGCEDYYPNRYNCVKEDSCIIGVEELQAMSYGDGTLIKAQVGITEIQFQSQVITNKQFFYVVQAENIQSSGQEDGILGLGTYDNLESDGLNWINQLKLTNFIPKNQFSLYLDNINSPNGGSHLILGDIITDYIKNYNGDSIQTYASANPTRWTILSNKMMLGDNVISEKNFQALIDSGTSALAFPPEIGNKLSDIYKNVYNLTQMNDLYYNDCTSDIPTLSFTFKDINGKEFEYTLESEFYAQQEANEGKNLCGIQFSILDLDHVILGDPFMRKYFSTFIYGENKSNFIQLAESISKGIPLKIFPKNDDKKINNDDDEGFPLWAKIVIPIVSVLILGVAIFFVVKYIKKRRMNKKQDLAESNASESTIHKPLYQ